MSKLLLLTIFLLYSVQALDKPRNTSLLCSGKPHYNVTLAAFYPDFESDKPSDYLDVRGKKLRNLQDYLDNRAEFVTVAMDMPFTVPYGTEICVPELNRHFRRYLRLQVRDRDPDLWKRGFTRLDICVRNEADSYDRAVNRIVTIFV